MQVWEVVAGKATKNKTKGKTTQSKRADTGFVANAARLRSKERALNARGPVPPIKHRP